MNTEDIDDWNIKATAITALRQRKDFFLRFMDSKNTGFRHYVLSTAFKHFIRAIFGAPSAEARRLARAQGEVRFALPEGRNSMLHYWESLTLINCPPSKYTEQIYMFLVWLASSFEFNKWIELQDSLKKSKIDRLYNQKTVVVVEEEEEFVTSHSAQQPTTDSAFPNCLPDDQDLEFEVMDVGWFKTFINTTLKNTMRQLLLNDHQNLRMDALVYHLVAEYVATVGTFEPEPGPDMERALRELDAHVRKYRNNTTKDIVVYEER